VWAAQPRIRGPPAAYRLLVGAKDRGLLGRDVRSVRGAGEVRGVHSEEVDIRGREFGRQVENELDPQAAELGGHAVHRHALVAQREHLVGLADARVGDSDRVAVEVADGA